MGPPTHRQQRQSARGDCRLSNTLLNRGSDKSSCKPPRRLRRFAVGNQCSDRQRPAWTALKVKAQQHRNCIEHRSLESPISSELSEAYRCALAATMPRGPAEVIGTAVLIDKIAETAAYRRVRQTRPPGLRKIGTRQDHRSKACGLPRFARIQAADLALESSVSWSTSHAGRSPTRPHPPTPT